MASPEPKKAQRRRVLTLRTLDRASPKAIEVAQEKTYRGLERNFQFTERCSANTLDEHARADPSSQGRRRQYPLTRSRAGA